MTEYREALARMTLAIQTNPMVLSDAVIATEYHAAKELLARGEPRSDFADLVTRLREFDWYGPPRKGADALLNEAASAIEMLARGEPEPVDRLYQLLVVRGYAQHEAFAIAHGPPLSVEPAAAEKVRPFNADEARAWKAFIEEFFEPAAAEKLLPDDGSYIERPPPKGYASWYDAAVDERLKRVAAEKARERYQEGDVLLFIGWLSGDIAELRKVEVPRLADSWRRFKEALTSTPASKVAAEKAREPHHVEIPADNYYLNRYAKLADKPTPKAQQGTWTLTAPDGRQWQADSPLKCAAIEQRERVPADVALGRLYRGITDDLPSPPAATGETKS